jgi:hypothetical protein
MVATTSNAYQFGQNTQLDDLFRESFERIGIIGNDQTPLHVQSAIMAANLELAAWPGKGLNLWLVQRLMFNIYPNQPIYPLPSYIVRVLELSAVTPIRLNTGGVAFSSAGGNAANCFDPMATAGCVQTSQNGYISYDYGAGNSNSILYVGITPLSNATYTLAVEYSFDNINWITAYSAPSQQYYVTQTNWLVIEQAVNARAWRIRETGGATLAIQQIYFDQPTNVGVGDRLLTALSRSEYMALPGKMNPGVPSGYYFDEEIKPTIVLWPVPSSNSQATSILYTGYRYAQDVTQMFQNIEVPQRFYDALIAGLSSRLALKFKPDRYQLMKGEAIEAYEVAAKTDFENVTIRFQPDFGRYGY